MQDIVAKLVPGIVEGKHEDKDHDIMSLGAYKDCPLLWVMLYRETERMEQWTAFT